MVVGILLANFGVEIVVLQFLANNCQNAKNSYTLDIESSMFMYGNGSVFGAGLE